MSLATVLGEKSRLRALLDHLSVIEDPPRGVAGRPSAAGGSAAGGLRHDRRLRRLRDDRSLGEAAPGVPAPLPALPSRGAGGTLAHAADEPDRSGPVLGLLQRLGPRGLAGSARPDRHGKTARAPQP